MLSEMIHVGFGNILAANRIIAITNPGSSPTKRTILNAKNANLLIDMTNGRRNKSVIYLDSGHIVLAALSPETLSGRFQTVKPVITKTDIEEELEDED